MEDFPHIGMLQPCISTLNLIIEEAIWGKSSNPHQQTLDRRLQPKNVDRVSSDVD